MTTKATVPAIRFAGFTTPWELRKFDNLYIRAREKNDLSYGKDKIISVANMYFKTNNYITDDEYLKTYNVFKLGDIAFEGNKSKHFAHGRFVENTIGDGIVSHVFDVFRPKTTYDLLFWKHLINNESIMSDLLVRCTKSSTMMTNLVADDFLKESLLVPKVEEQRLIGKYLSQLDELIALQRRKLVQLQNVKKAMLQKMFPTRGSTTPQIRFAGFTEPWELRSLSDVVAVGSGKDYKHLDEGKIPVYGTGGYMLSVNEALSYNADAVGIGRKGTIDKPYLLEAPFWTVDTLFYCIPRRGFDLHFSLQLFRNIDWRQKDESTGVPSLSKETINTVEVLTPHLNEQKRIGDFFKHLDTRISLQQRKLEKLQNVKKACLAAMFV